MGRVDGRRDEHVPGQLDGERSRDGAAGEQTWGEELAGRRAPTPGASTP